MKKFNKGDTVYHFSPKALVSKHTITEYTYIGEDKTRTGTRLAKVSFDMNGKARPAVRYEKFIYHTHNEACTAAINHCESLVEYFKGQIQ